MKQSFQDQLKNILPLAMIMLMMSTSNKLHLEPTKTTIKNIETINFFPNKLNKNIKNH